MCSLVITITTHDIFQYLKANQLALYQSQLHVGKCNIAEIQTGMVLCSELRDTTSMEFDVNGLDGKDSYQ